MARLDDISNPLPHGAGQQRLELRDVVPKERLLEDLTILKIVNQDIQLAEAELISSGRVDDWARCETLYLFRVPIQFWEGTNIPRAHLGVPLVMEHVESMIPQIMNGIFPQPFPIQSRPFPNTRMEVARARDKLIEFWFERVEFRRKFRQLLKYLFVYGTAIGKWGWRSYMQQEVKLRRKLPAVFVGTEVGGELVEQSPEVEEVVEEHLISEPFFEVLDLRSVLFDPGLREADIRKARWVAHIQYVTINDLDMLREVEGYEIPPREKLVQLFFPPKEEPTETAIEKQSTGAINDPTYPGSRNFIVGGSTALRFETRPRSEASTIDPYNSPLELIEYWTPDRFYAVLQRRLIIGRGNNRWGQLPFVSAALVEVPNQAYGLGYAHLIGGEQRLQQGVLNAFLDDLSLLLNGMFFRVRGSGVLTQQVRVRPGAVIDTDTEKGIGILPRQPIPIEALTVLANSDARSQRRTGANEILVQGSPPSERSSITRTATGVERLTAGVGVRLGDLIDRLSETIVIPTADAFFMMSRKMMNINQVRDLFERRSGFALDVDPLEILNARGKFTTIAGTHLQAKRGLAEVLPFLFQFLLTEPVLAAIRQQGKRVSIEELVNMLWDVSGWPNRADVIQPMSEEERLQLVTENPLVQQLLTKQANIALEKEANLEQIQEQGVADIAKEIMSKVADRAVSNLSGTPAKESET